MGVDSARSWSDYGEIDLRRFENGKKHGALKARLLPPRGRRCAGRAGGRQSRRFRSRLEYLALSVCIDGHEGASLDFNSCIRDEPYVATVDARTLAIFATSRSRATLASIAVAKSDVYAPQRAMAKVAKALGLDDPLFAKAIDGVLLTFT